MHRDLWDEVIDGVNEALPPMNRYTLRGYRQDKISEIPEYLEMVYREAVKRFGVDENGNPEVIYRGYRFLTPEECLAYDATMTKYSKYVDVLRTELALAEFMFEHKGVEFSTQIYIPYLTEDAIIINGSRYYVMFALTDKVFYHISKDNGIGIKILCAHLRFWRSPKFSFSSTNGTTYADQLIMCKIHMRSYNYASNDLKPVLMLYPIVKFGLRATLERYGMDPNSIMATNHHDEYDPDYEYFEIIPEMVNESTGEVVKVGLYLRAHKSVVDTRLDVTNRIPMQILSTMIYILSYFRKVKHTNFTNNVELVEYLNFEEERTVYKIILGKTIFGLNYENELQVMGHMVDHLESLEIYMDPDTKRKLRSIGIECEDVYDLIHYVSLHMDEYVANYFPSNVYNKQMNVLDLLVGNLVNILFHGIYRLTNKTKQNNEHPTKKIMNSLRVGSKILSRIYMCSGLINSNPSTYNNNGLLTYLGRRKRATFTTMKGGDNFTSNKSRNDTSLLQDPEHRTHSSIHIVESGSRTQTTDPTKSGTINPFIEITPDGNIVVPDWIKAEAASVDKYIHSK